MENIGKISMLILSFIIGTIIHGFVIMKLWMWFIVSTFQMKPLRLVEAIGIGILISYFNARLEKESDEKFSVRFSKAVIFIILTSGFALLSGWIISLFI